MHYNFLYYLLGFVLGTWRVDSIMADNRDVECAVLTVWRSPVCGLFSAAEVDLD